MFTSVAAQCSVPSSSLRLVSHWSSTCSNSAPPTHVLRLISYSDSLFGRDKSALYSPAPEDDSAGCHGDVAGCRPLGIQSMSVRGSYRGRDDRRGEGASFRGRDDRREGGGSYRSRDDRREGDSGRRPVGRDGYNDRPRDGYSEERRPAFRREEEDSVYVKRFSGERSEVNFRRGEDQQQQRGESFRQPDRGVSRSTAWGRDRDWDVRGGSTETRSREWNGERKGDVGSRFQRDGDSGANTAGSRFGGRRNNATSFQSDGGLEGEAEEEGGATGRAFFEGGKDDGFKTEKKKRVKEPAIAPQMTHERVINKNPEVAILGGGMSGLVCALTLEKLGIRSTVFDTGKHGLGGRMATRHIELREGSAPLIFDHAAQFFTVTDPRFQKLVDQWVSQGAVKEWTGSLGTLKAGGQYTELPPAARYVGSHGMRLLADHLVSQSKLITVRRPVWISKMYPHNSRWSLSEYKNPEGTFDAVVIAHNGKCANRLLAPAGAPFIYKQMKRMELSSIWALMAAFDDPLPAPQGVPGGHLAGAFVEGINAVTWIGNNTSKLSRDAAPHCYTFFSSAQYGKKNKVPQESIPVVRAQRVTREMLQGVEVALGLEEGSMPKPFFSKVQLWGAGLPTNTPGLPCIFDAFSRVGICGDWLLGSSLEAAAISGIAMAEHIADYRDRGDLNPEEFCVGLEKGFTEIEGHDIGQFPGLSTRQEPSSLELVAA